MNKIEKILREYEKIDKKIFELREKYYKGVWVNVKAQKKYTDLLRKQQELLGVYHGQQITIRNLVSVILKVLEYANN